MEGGSFPAEASTDRVGQLRVKHQKLSAFPNGSPRKQEDLCWHHTMDMADILTPRANICALRKSIRYAGTEAKRRTDKE